METREKAEAVLKFVPSSHCIGYARLLKLVSRWMPEISGMELEKIVGRMLEECVIFEPQSMCYQVVAQGGAVTASTIGGEHMEKVSDIYKSKGNFLSALTLKSEKLTGKTLAVKAAVKELVGAPGDPKTRDKIVLDFGETDRRLVCNATNARILAEAWGEEYEAWAGKSLQMIITKRNYQGSLVDGIQVIPTQGGLP